MGPPASEQVGPHTIREAQITPETRRATKRADIPCLPFPKQQNNNFLKKYNKILGEKNNNGAHMRKKAPQGER
jgi:UDP-galactopyranose mutase